VKLVINENLLPRELETACTIIADIDRTIPLVIQPVFGSEQIGLLDIQKKALEYLDDVRILPQIHKYLHLQ
jgi:organic radical activating enzyme